MSFLAPILGSLTGIPRRRPGDPEGQPDADAAYRAGLGTPPYVEPHQPMPRVGGEELEPTAPAPGTGMSRVPEGIIRTAPSAVVSPPSPPASRVTGSELPAFSLEGMRRVGVDPVEAAAKAASGEPTMRPTMNIAPPQLTMPGAAVNVLPQQPPMFTPAASRVVDAPNTLSTSGRAATELPEPARTLPMFGGGKTFSPEELQAPPPPVPATSGVGAGQVDQLSPFQPPQRPHGFLNNLLYYAKHVGKGALLGAASGGGPGAILGGLMGGISPTMADKWEYNAITTPREMQRIGFQNQMATDAMRRQVEESGLTGMYGGQPTEGARERQARIMDAKGQHEIANEMRRQTIAIQDRNATTAEKKGEVTASHIKAVIDRDKRKQLTAEANQFLKNVAPYGTLTPEMRQAFEDKYDVQLPADFDPRRHQLVDTGTGGWQSVVTATGQGTTATGAGGKPLTSPKAEAERNKAARAAAAGTGRRMTQAQAYTAAEKEMRGQGLIDDQGTMPNPKYEAAIQNAMQTFGVDRETAAKTVHKYPERIPFAEHDTFKNNVKHKQAGEASDSATPTGRPAGKNKNAQMVPRAKVPQWAAAKGMTEQEAIDAINNSPNFYIQ